MQIRINGDQSTVYLNMREFYMVCLFSLKDIMQVEPTREPPQYCPFFNKHGRLEPSLQATLPEKYTHSLLKQKLSGHKMFKFLSIVQGGQKKRMTTILQDDSIQN